MVDICPVGALLSKDFLHKARAWDLDKTASVCPGCSQGCNITLDTRDDSWCGSGRGRTSRSTSYCMCDHGRADYRWMNRGDRIEAPLVRQRDGWQRAVDWDQAIDRAADDAARRRQDRRWRSSRRAHRPKRCSSRARYLCRARLDRLVPRRSMGEEAPLAGVPNLALRAERAPNATGAELLGYNRDYDGRAGGRRGRGAWCWCSMIRRSPCRPAAGR